MHDELLSQGAFYGMGRAETRRRADELLESLDLTALAKRPVAGLSGGQKRRLDIALGLLHSPQLLFLDEPSTGLDPQSRENLWQHLLDLRRTHGTTIFVTSHYLDEADRFAERVMVMDHGRIIADDTAMALKTNLAGDVITLGFNSAAEAEAGRPTAARVTTAAISIKNHELEITLEQGDRVLPGLLRELDAAGTPAATARLKQPTLDDVFLALTGRSLREDNGARNTTDHNPSDKPTAKNTALTNEVPA